MIKLNASFFRGAVQPARVHWRTVHVRVACFALSCLSLAGVANAVDNSWTGTTNNLWSVGTNWNLGSPAGLAGGGDVARFDQLSTSNLTINNDVTGLSIAGFANTALAANNGPAGPVTITGNPITLGATGIINGSGNPLDPNYPGPAQASITVDVDLTLSADQRWKTGGPGTATTAPARRQSGGHCRRQPQQPYRHFKRFQAHLERDLQSVGL